MSTLIAKGVLAAALLQAAFSAAAQDHGWDCPGSGHLPFRGGMLVTTGELAALIDASEATVIHVGFDETAGPVPRRARYEDGHLPGALHLKAADLQGPLTATASRIAAFEALGLTPGRRVVLYDTGLGFEAAAAYAALDALGLAEHASLLDGHWVKWVSEGRPLCRWTAEAEAAPLEIHPTGAALTQAELAALLSRPDLTVLDARREASPWLKMRGTEQLASLRIPVMKSESELRRLWSGVPARTDHRVVAAGADWRQAAPVYVAAKLLGYSVQLLDGSLESRESLERGP